MSFECNLANRHLWPCMFTVVIYVQGDKNWWLALLRHSICWWGGPSITRNQFCFFFGGGGGGALTLLLVCFFFRHVWSSI
jgi:hypothetical protein